MTRANKVELFKRYLKSISDVALAGDAREESFYGSLKNMLEEAAQTAGRANVHVTTLPKKTEAGNPDFRVWNGTDRVIGYIEAKKPTVETLDEAERSEQLSRYLGTFPNVILTNFMEFRLYRNGDRIDSVAAARPFVLNQIGRTPPLEKPDELWALLERFFDFSLPQAFSAETLAVELAKRTRFLRDVVAEQLAEEEHGSRGVLSGFYEAFQKFLIGGLAPTDFADLYAQTITYGLFAARTRTGDHFNRRTAFDNIPHTIGILRDVFRFISLGELPRQLEWIVDDISEVLAIADAPGILDRYYHEGRGSDPIVHFYETFLAQYDPEERERRGVYYTPEPIVSYIVRSLHHLLKTEFGMADGLASEGVTLLDPAAGTMTFVARAAQEAVAEFESKYGSGGREEFIRNHILKNFYAFELMMAPYAVGHLKMAFFLEELGHRLADDERVRFYLTNTLDMEELAQSALPGFSSLAEESHLAGEVKKRQPILVILGNPPYSGHSVNRGRWILDKINDYKRVDGKPLGEKNPKWLQDDYVKFLRFAQWKIEQAGRGAVGMITNHSYLDNPTFRGMRQSLMQTFDDIFVLDLHGNSLKKEMCPDGSKDENVFDIRQGVAIAFFIKRGQRAAKPARVHHGERWGLRNTKHEWLNGHDVASTSWGSLEPKSEFYLLVPRDESAMQSYGRFLRLREFFPLGGTGIITKRDALTIHYSKENLWRTVQLFSSLPPEDARRAFKLPRDVRDWHVERAQEDLRHAGLDTKYITPVLYRPFDTRFTYYTGVSRGFLGWPVPNVMRHMLVGENLALIAARSNKSPTMDHFFCSEHIVETKCGESTVQSYTFPLFLYPEQTARDLFSHYESAERHPNLNRAIMEALGKKYGSQLSPERIFNYVYSILYAKTYRTKYAEFLKIDFPRIPFTANPDTFHAMAALGERLVALHLLKSPELDQPAARFEGEGDNRVAENKSKGFRYEAAEERFYINKAQYFEPVPSDVWEYLIGGYQVCEKWLKDRRKRLLGVEDIRTYCRIVTALGRTIEIQREIDELYPEVEAELLMLGEEGQKG